MIEEREERLAEAARRREEDSKRLHQKFADVLHRFVGHALTREMMYSVQHSLMAALHTEPPLGDEENTNRHIIVTRYQDDPHSLNVSLVSQIMFTRRFVHDCTRCRYLGTALDHDLYYCTQMETMPTVIARYGDEGPQYTSGIEFGMRPSRTDDSEDLRALRIGYTMLFRLGIDRELPPTRHYPRPEEA